VCELALEEFTALYELVQHTYHGPGNTASRLEALTGALERSGHAKLHLRWRSLLSGERIALSEEVNVGGGHERVRRPIRTSMMRPQATSTPTRARSPAPLPNGNSVAAVGIEPTPSENVTTRRPVIDSTRLSSVAPINELSAILLPNGGGRNPHHQHLSMLSQYSAAPAAAAKPVTSQRQQQNTEAVPRKKASLEECNGEGG